MALPGADEEERRYAMDLATPRVLPRNVSDMKTFAFGKLTWRDVLVSGMCLLLPNAVALTLLGAFVPQVACVIIGTALAIPLVVVANKHLITGDLPIEERIRILMRERGQNNLMSWDKTRRGGGYIPTSTQSFVPDVEFVEPEDASPGSDEVNFALLSGNHGGFAVLKVDVEDMTTAKSSERLRARAGFMDVLNACITPTSCTPIQIYLQASLLRMKPWTDNALEDMRRATSEGLPATRGRAYDYFRLLYGYDAARHYAYSYYIVVTYRDDAEDVGNDSMNTMSVKRERLKERANPFRKQMDAAASVDFKIGDDRAKVSRQFLAESEFGAVRTRNALMARVRDITAAMSMMGGTGVSCRLLGRRDVARLFFEFFNRTDKYASGPVLDEALRSKDVIASRSVEADFPDLFPRGGEPEGRPAMPEMGGDDTPEWWR